MQINKTLGQALVALVAGITVSRDNLKLSLKKGKTPAPIPAGELLDGIPADLYEVDPTVGVRQLPVIQQEFRGIVSPWAPMTADILGANWCIHSEPEEEAGPVGEPGEAPRIGDTPAPSEDPAAS